MENITLEQVFHFFEVLGPVFGVIAAIITPFAALLGWFIRRAWRANQKRLLNLANALKDLSEAQTKAIGRVTDAVNLDRQMHAEEIQAIRELYAALRMEIALSTRSVQEATGKIHELKGVVELQQKEIGTANVALAKIDGKLIAVFRFIDAPKRGTDSDTEG